MARQPGCAFCDIVAGDGPARIVYQDRGVTVFLPDEPATRGHILVVPDAHVSDVWELDQGTARTLASEVLRVSRAVKDSLDPEGLNIIQSNGAVAEQTVGHLHVHVLPRWSDDAVGDIWPESPAWSASELDAMQAAIASAIGTAAAPGYDLTNDQDREDRRKHLELVTAAISRMAGSSAAAKGWAVALAGAAFGVALVQESWPLIALGIVVLIAFGMVDARYLDAERRARDIYTAVADHNTMAPFSVTGLAVSTTKDRWWWPARFQSWSVRNFYGALVLAGIVLLVCALLGVAEKDSSDDPPCHHRHHHSREH